MKIYNVYVKKDASNPLDTAQFVRQGGFNLIAAILHFMWALYYRLWFWAAVIFVTFALLVFFGATNFFAYEAVMFARIGHFCWIGLSANDWLCKSLENKGYILAGIVAGNTELEARTKFLQAHVA